MKISRLTISSMCTLAVLATFNAFAIDSMYITPTGDVGIGTVTPMAKLHVTGNIRTDNYFRGQSVNPGFWIDETGVGNKGANVVLDGGVLQFQRRAQGFGAFEASVMRVNINAPAQSFTLNSSGYLGLGVTNSSSPVEAANGARLSVGGVWQNASSRDLKENIRSLDAAEAMSAFKALEPVAFNYKVDAEDTYIGFIAEDVPEIVASKDHATLSSMDMVALLTRVVQEQQGTIEERALRMETIEHQIGQQKQRMDELETLLRLVAGLADTDGALAINTK